MAIDEKLIDQLLTNYKKPEDIIGENGLFSVLKKSQSSRSAKYRWTTCWPRRMN